LVFLSLARKLEVIIKEQAEHDFCINIIQNIVQKYAQNITTKKKSGFLL